MSDEKKTQLGTAPERPRRATGGPPLAAATGGRPGGPGGPSVPGDSGGAAEAPSATPPRTSYLAEAPDPLLGATIAGRYRLIRKLGEGGMGAVYLALHTVLEKQVAIKILHGEFARKADLVDRFMREAKAASRIRHQNVIDISDFGATDDGIVFFAMELLDGHDLHDEITRARLAGQLLPWSRSKKIFLQICGALAAAHACGVIHRDLKPENVYLVAFLEDPDFVKLLDFGIAKISDHAGAGAGEDGGRRLTRTGMLFGTPEYMAPEQARGERVDHRADIYAMGCILFQLVSNSVPFRADNFMAVLSQHLTAEPPLIAPEVFDQIGAPRALAEVIDRALAKDPNARFQSAEDLANAIRGVCGDPPAADLPVRSRAPSVSAPATLLRQRPPTGQHAPGGQGLGPGSPADGSGRAWAPRAGDLASPESKAGPGGGSTFEAAPARPRARAPRAIGAVLLVAGGVAASVVALGRHGATGPASDGQGSVRSAASSGSGRELPPPGSGEAVSAPLHGVPAVVSVTFVTTPGGALIVDAADPAASFGRTPTTFAIPGSVSPRRFKLVLAGYGDNVVELVPNRASIEVAKELVRAGQPDPITRIPDLGEPTAAAAPHLPPAAGSGGERRSTGDAAAPRSPAGPGQTTTVGRDVAATSRGAAGATETAGEGQPAVDARPGGDGSASTSHGSAVAAPPEEPRRGSAGPARPDCPDDEVPCLKSFP